MKNTISVLVVLAVIIFGGFYYFNNKNAPSQQAGSTAPSSQVKAPVSNAKTYQIDIKGFAFSKQSINIRKGDTVVWNNKDSVPHTVTGDNGDPLDSAVPPGQSHSFTFYTVGTFAYHCSFHPSMKASVTVSK